MSASLRFVLEYVDELDGIFVRQLRHVVECRVGFVDDFIGCVMGQ